MRICRTRLSLAASLLALDLAWATGCASARPKVRAGIELAAEPADPSWDVPTPMDPSVHTGRLANGLIYYVARRPQPEGRAVLWLAVNVGSAAKDDDERGLAHFVEHLALEGTAHFPRRAIAEQMAAAGMRFGSDVNASTTFDQTTYELGAAVDDAPLVLRSLDILRDIATDVTFGPAAVDAERAALKEEWRHRLGVGRRIWEQLRPVLARGSRYADRSPIGTLDVIGHASPQSLRRFYTTWYRPELMAVIAVGDFDPGAIERAIQGRFASIPASTEHRPAPVVRVPHEEPTQFVVSVDPEQQHIGLQFIDRRDRPRHDTKRTLRRTLVGRLYRMMLSNRLNRMAIVPKSPFLDTSVTFERFGRPLELWTTSATVKDGQILPAIRALSAERNRIEGSPSSSSAT